MINTNKNPNFAFIVSGISDPEMVLWKNLLSQLISRDLEIVYTLEDELNQEDSKFIETIEKPLNLESLDNRQSFKNKEWYLFATTADCLSNSLKSHQNVKFACFFGGLSACNYEKQIHAARSLDVKLLFSDVLPSEIETRLSKEDFSFFAEKHVFLPSCPNSSFDNQVSNSNENTLHIYHSNFTEKNNYKLEQILSSTLKKTEGCRVVELSEESTRVWLQKCTPGSGCKRVSVGNIPIPLYDYISNICLRRGIALENILNKQKLASERLGLNKNHFLLNKLEQRALNPNFSLRYIVQKFFEDTDSHNLSKREIVEESDNISSDSIIFSIMDLPQDFSGKITFDNRLSIFRKYQKDLFEQGKKNEKNPNFINDSFRYLTKFSSESCSLHHSLNFYEIVHKSEAAELQNFVVPQELLISSLKLSLELPLNGSLIYCLSKLFFSFKDNFISAVEKVYSFSHDNKQKEKLASVLCVILLEAEIEANERKRLCQRVLKLEIPLHVRASLLFELEEFSEFDRLVSQSSSNFEIAGEAFKNLICYRVLLSNNQKEHIIKFYSDKHSHEIINFASHFSSLSSKIFSNNENYIIEESDLSSGKFSQILSNPFHLIRIGRLALLENRHESLDSILRFVSIKSNGKYLFSLIELIAYRSLCNTDNNIDSILPNFPTVIVNGYFSGTNSSFYTSVSLEILLRVCGLDEEIGKIKRIRKNSRIRLNQAFETTLKGVKSMTDPNPKLIEICQTLVSKI